jgi:hypothetical protein
MKASTCWPSGRADTHSAVSFGGNAYEPPFPTLTIGQLRTVEVSRTVIIPFFFTASTWVSLVISVGVTPAFQATNSSRQSGV